MTHVAARSTSNLDRCLISEDWISSQWNPLLKATHALNFGHKIVQMQLQVRPTVLNNPRHRKHDTIPASVFMPGKDGTPAQAGTEALQGLIGLLHRTRAHFLGCQCKQLFPSLIAADSAPSAFPSRSAGEELSSLSRDSVYEIALQRHHRARQMGDLPRDDMTQGVCHLVDARFHFSSCFWAWWKSQPNPKHNDTIAPAFLARKYFGGQSQYINVPKNIVADLICRSKGVVLADIGELAACGEAVVLPRLKLHDMLEVIDTLSSEATYLPIDEANAQARGLGNMVAFWEHTPAHQRLVTRA